MILDVFAEPKVDCHVHVLDPEGFPYAPDVHYRPAGQETGTAEQLFAVMDAYGTRRALIVGPNSGYGLDNRCLLDALARSEGRCKGIAVVRNDVSLDELASLQRAGIVGVAWNVTYYGLDYYRDAAGLLGRLRELDMFVDVQVEHELLIAMQAMLPILESGVRILVDHAGRPTGSAGVGQPGFRALLDLAASGRAYVKLSGVAKFSREKYPFADAKPYFDALLDAFTPDGCMWASDWPHLRAPGRMDYGVLLKHIEHVLPDPAQRRRVLWDTPNGLFGFA
jgi:predicted TIM-barrel fold metal-dependent hydrolase